MRPIIAKNLTGQRIDIAANKPIKKKNDEVNIINQLENIVIPHISFEGVPVVDAIMFLRDESKRLDPSGKGINIIMKFDPTKSPDAHMTNYIMDQIPLKKAIEDICIKAGVFYKFDRYAVIISSSPLTGANLITKVFPAEKDDFGTLLFNLTEPAFDMKEYLTERGILFSSAEASAIYDFRISRLIVRNTSEELQKVKEILEKLDTTINPMIAITAKFIEVAQTDFEELGFQWEYSNSQWQYPGESTKPMLRNAYTMDTETVKKDREFGFSIDQSGTKVDAILHALSQTEKNGNSRIS